MSMTCKDSASHKFMNAGIGLLPTSRCVHCMGTAAEHPDMQIALAHIKAAGPKLIGGRVGGIVAAEALAAHVAALLLTNSLEDVIEAVATYTETYIGDGLLGEVPLPIKLAGSHLIQHLRVLKQFACIIDEDDFGTSRARLNSR